MSNQRRLGRGLEALLGRSLDDPTTGAPTAPIEDHEAPAPADQGVMTRDEEGQRWLDLGVIEPNPFQPRKTFDEEQIADLTDSIREHGVLQPLVVRRVDGRFELVAGERRLRAAQAAGWQRVPVLIRDVDERQTAELAIVENLQRTDLNAIEKAESFGRYLREYDCTQEELAKRVSINRTTVANFLRLLDLPAEVKQMVIDEKLAQGHARALLALPAEVRTEYAERVAKEGLSVRKTEQLVQEAQEVDLRVVGDDGVSRQPGTGKSAQIQALETELKSALGTKVELRQSAKGSGKITLHFANADEFDRLRSLLTSTASQAKASA